MSEKRYEFWFFSVKNSIGFHSFNVRFKLCHFSELSVNQSQKDIANKFVLFSDFGILETTQKFLSLLVLLLPNQMLRLFQSLGHTFLIGIRLSYPGGRFQKFSKLCFIELSCKSIYRFAIVKHVYCGYSFYLEGLGDLSEFVYVYFEEFQFASGFVNSLFESGSQLFTGSAPIRIEVDEQGLGASSKYWLQIFNLFKLYNAFNMLLVKLFALFFGLGKIIFGRLLAVTKMESVGVGEEGRSARCEFGEEVKNAIEFADMEHINHNQLQ